MAERVSTLKAVADAATTWLKTEGARAGDAASENATALLRELGFVSRDDYDDLALRVAQLEHRVRLLEGATEAPVPVQPRGTASARSEPDLPSTPTS